MSIAVIDWQYHGSSCGTPQCNDFGGFCLLTGRIVAGDTDWLHVLLCHVLFELYLNRRLTNCCWAKCGIGGGLAKIVPIYPTSSSWIYSVTHSHERGLKSLRPIIIGTPGRQRSEDESQCPSLDCTTSTYQNFRIFEATGFIQIWNYPAFCVLSYWTNISNVIKSTQDPFCQNRSYNNSRELRGRLLFFFKMKPWTAAVSVCLRPLLCGMYPHAVC